VKRVVHGRRIVSEGSLDFAGSGKCVATGKPISSRLSRLLVPANAREGMSEEGVDGLGLPDFSQQESVFFLQLRLSAHCYAELLVRSARIPPP
jgi:hypothetical protein